MCGCNISSIQFHSAKSAFLSNELKCIGGFYICGHFRMLMCSWCYSFENENVFTTLYFGNALTSDVLEHKWRASLKTILFLYE